MNGKRISIRNVPTGETGLTFQWDEPKKCLPFTSQFPEFAVNGKQPTSVT